MLRSIENWYTCGHMHMERRSPIGRVAFAVMCFSCVFAAVTAQARVEYAWSAPFALAETVTNAPAVQTGDQHTLLFTNGVVRVHHRVTDTWFDLQPAPFAAVAAVKRLDDGRLLVVEAGGARAAYGTPARTKP